MLIIGAYQFSLSHLGLSDYLVHGAKGGGSRSGLLDANREGIVSCVGYVALYLGSVQLGRFIFKSRLVHTCVRLRTAVCAGVVCVCCVVSVLCCEWVSVLCCEWVSVLCCEWVSVLC